MTSTEISNSHIKSIVKEICTTWDIQISRTADLTVSKTSTTNYRVAVPIGGTVILDDLLDTQGRLLGIKDGIEISLFGFDENGQLLLSVLTE